MRQEVMSLSLFRIQWADREHPETAPGILGAEAASALTTRRPGYAGGGGVPDIQGQNLLPLQLHEVLAAFLSHHLCPNASSPVPHPAPA